MASIIIMMRPGKDHIWRVNEQIAIVLVAARPSIRTGTVDYRRRLEAKEARLSFILWTPMVVRWFQYYTPIFLKRLAVFHVTYLTQSCALLLYYVLCCINVSIFVHEVEPRFLRSQMYCMGVMWRLFLDKTSMIYLMEKNIDCWKYKIVLLPIPLSNDSLKIITASFSKLSIAPQLTIVNSK